MQVIASYLMYLERLYITCLTLLSKLSQRERGRTYCNNIQTTSFFKQRVEKQNNNNMHWNNKNNNYYMDTIIITFMKTCKSCIFTPMKSPFFVMIFFMFAQNPIGNLIFHVTYFTTLLCCSIHIHGIDFILIWYPLL